MLAAQQQQQHVQQLQHEQQQQPAGTNPASRRSPSLPIMRTDIAITSFFVFMAEFATQSAIAREQKP